MPIGRRRTTISYYGSHEQAKADAKKASMQIDGLEPGDTSPVHEGAGDGSATLHLNMEGEKEFTDKRTRPKPVGHTMTMRRELHPIPLKKGADL